MNPVDLQTDHKEDDISYRFWYHQFSWLNNHQYNHCLNPLDPKLDPYPVAVAWPLLPSSCGLRPLPVPAAAFAALPPGKTISDRMECHVFFWRIPTQHIAKPEGVVFSIHFSGYPLVNIQKTMEITIFKWPFSIAMLVYQRLFGGFCRLSGRPFSQTLPKPPVPIWLRRTLQACGVHACPVGIVAGGFGYHNLEIQRQSNIAMENTVFFDDFPVNTFIYNRISYCQVSIPANVNPACGKNGNCCSRILCFKSSPLNPQAFGLAHLPLPLGMRTCLTGWEQNKCTSQGFHCSTSQRKPVEEEENTTYLSH